MEAVEHQTLDRRRADRRMLLDLELRSIDTRRRSTKKTYDDVQDALQGGGLSHHFVLVSVALRHRLLPWWRLL